VGVPVVNPVIAALKAAEACVAMGPVHSKKAGR
jgi:Asp/Glu/hydantoin racemase